MLLPDSTSSDLTNLGADPGSITSPGSSTPPAVGATPKDGPEGIQSPSSATGGVLPPVTSLPDAGSVTSPGSSGDVKALGEVTVYPGVSLTEVLTLLAADLETYDDDTKKRLNGVLEDPSLSIIEKLVRVIEAVSESQTLALSGTEKGNVQQLLNFATMKGNDASVLPPDVQVSFLLDLAVYLMSTRGGFLGSNSWGRAATLNSWGEMARKARASVFTDVGNAKDRINLLLNNVTFAVYSVPGAEYGAYYTWKKDVYDRVAPLSQKVLDAAIFLGVNLVLAVLTEGLVRVGNKISVARGYSNKPNGGPSANQSAAVRAEIEELLHWRSLAIEEVGGKSIIRVGEANGAVAFEKQTGVRLARSTEPGFDYKGSNGKSYDVKGGDFKNPSKVDPTVFVESIINEITVTPTTNVIINLQQLNAVQQTVILAKIQALPPGIQSKIVLIVK